MVGATTFRRERLRAAAGADFSTATDLADHLAQRGLPFRDAHRVVGALVRDCLASGRELPDLGLDELRRFSDAFAPDAVGITAERAVAARRSHGGTAPERVRESLAPLTGASGPAEDGPKARRAAHPTLSQALLLERRLAACRAEGSPP